MTFVGLIIAGIIIGALGRLFLPGRQKIGFLATMAVGIVGTLIGYGIAAGLGVEDTGGVDWIRWIISVAVSALLVSVFVKLTGRGVTR